VFEQQQGVRPSRQWPYSSILKTPGRRLVSVNPPPPPPPPPQAPYIWILNDFDSFLSIEMKMKTLLVRSAYRIKLCFF
jgi:hypothetical protein